MMSVTEPARLATSLGVLLTCTLRMRLLVLICLMTRRVQTPLPPKMMLFIEAVSEVWSPRTLRLISLSAILFKSTS